MKYEENYLFHNWAEVHLKTYGLESKTETNIKIQSKPQS